MQRTHILTAMLTAAGTIGLAAALGLGQPDGIDPPAGPVGDTQPSLTSIDQRLANMQSELIDVPWDYIVSNTGSSPTTIIGNRIRLGRIIVPSGAVHVSNATDFDFTFVSSREVASGSFQNNEPMQYDLDIVVNGPVDVSVSSTLQEGYVLMYRVVE